MEKFEAVVGPMQQVAAVQFKGKVDADGMFEGFPTREDPSRQPIQLAVLVPTANGGTPAFPGDWIVNDASDQLSVVSESYFATHYKLLAPSESVSPSKPVWRLTPQQIAGRQAAAAAAQKAEAAKSIME